MRGKLLVLGGDLCYPFPTSANYRNRFIRCVLRAVLRQRAALRAACCVPACLRAVLRQRAALRAACLRVVMCCAALRARAVLAALSKTHYRPQSHTTVTQQLWKSQLRNSCEEANGPCALLCNALPVCLTM